MENENKLINKAREMANREKYRPLINYDDDSDGKIKQK